MDDRRFDEIMTEYVESNKRDKERILRKFREKEEQIPQKRHGFSGFAIAACACALIAVIALSVFLPLVLDKNKSGEQAEDGGRVELDYKIAYAAGYEASSVKYFEKKWSTNKESNGEYVVHDYGEYCDLLRAQIDMPRPSLDQSFFVNKSLIVIMAHDVEYKRSTILDVYKENDKVTVKVSKQKDNIFAQTVLAKSLNKSGIDLTGIYDICAQHTDLYILEVDKEAVKNINTVKVEIEYSKQLIDCDDAVERGLITEEDALSIQYYLQQEFIATYGAPADESTVPDNFVPAPKAPAELDEEMAKTIRRAYDDSCKQWGIGSVKDCDGNVVYLGTYNGYIATYVVAYFDLGLGSFGWQQEDMPIPYVFLCEVEE